MPRKKKVIGPQGPPPEPTAVPPVAEKEIKVTVETVEEAAGGEPEVKVTPGVIQEISEALKNGQRQPGLFEGLDDIVTALKLEEDHVGEQSGKLRKKLNALEERLGESDKHYDNLRAARKQAEKLLAGQRKNEEKGPDPSRV